MATTKWFNPATQQWEYTQVPYSSEPTGVAAALVATHEAAINPHSQYAPVLVADENYVTDDEKAGLDNAVSPSSTNPFVTTNELIATKYPPFSVTVTAGTLASGTIADILTPNGGTTIRVDEANPGGLTVELEFHDVVDFNSISLRLQYAGGSGHIIQQQLWNKTSLAWDLISEQIGPQTDLTWMTNGIGNSDNYVDAGVAKIRLFHVSPFNSSHYLLIDYASLVSSVGGAVTPIPTQTQAEAINDTSGTPFLWPVLRLKQFVTAWWSTISGDFLARVSGTATNLKEAKQLVTTAVTTLVWGSHVEINYAGNIDLSAGGITDIPSDDTEAFMVITQHHLGGLRSITWGETQPIGGLPTARGTTYTVYCLRPSAVTGNENKYFLECVGGR